MPAPAYFLLISTLTVVIASSNCHALRLRSQAFLPEPKRILGHKDIMQNGLLVLARDRMRVLIGDGYAGSQ
jgi:hypothetical protein